MARVVAIIIINLFTTCVEKFNELLSARRIRKTHHPTFLRFDGLNEEQDYTVSISTELDGKTITQVCSYEQTFSNKNNLSQMLFVNLKVVMKASKDDRLKRNDSKSDKDKSKGKKNDKD